MSTLTGNIAGTGIITPHGAHYEADLPPPLSEITNPETGKHHFIAAAPSAVAAHLSREPRLRRASGISLLAAAAAQTAIAASSITPGSRTALVLGVSSGCAHYTRRFYEQIVKTGANTASPLLFPETVHNAPASHLAAILRLDGATYTLIGDATIGLQALHFANQLLAMGDADQVIVAAAEELDWILAEGHHVWRLTSRDGKCRPHHGGGTLLAEGAAAIVLTAGGSGIKVTTAPGSTVACRRTAASAFANALAPFRDKKPDCVIDGADGTWIDLILARAEAPRRISPKATIGNALGASALQQVVIAASQPVGAALITALGWNQHAASAFVERD